MDINKQIKILVNRYKNELDKVQKDYSDDDSIQGFNNGEEYILKLIIKDLENLNE